MFISGAEDSVGYWRVAYTYYIAGTSSPNYILDRAWVDSTGSYTMYYGPRLTYDGLSEAEAVTNINRALLSADGDSRVNIKWTSTGYQLITTDQIAESIDPQGSGNLLYNHFLISKI